MVQHVWEGVKDASLDKLLIAVDSEELARTCEGFGAEVVLTGECVSGTERCWEAAKLRDVDIVVNIQGDEPMVRAIHVQTLLRGFDVYPRADVITLSTFKRPEDCNDENKVKVVTDTRCRAIYFSRANLALSRKHIGLYAYTKKALQWFAAFPGPVYLEKAERLEQLRFLQFGFDIRVLGTPFDTIGVDTAEDLERVREAMKCQ